MTTYIPRTLLANKGSPNERLLTEDEAAGLTTPLIILGDPGLGKTELTVSLRQRLGGLHVSAGTFHRSENLARLTPQRGRPLIIDGLDEIASTSGCSPIDEILRKLSWIGYPSFILSCRSADWQGSTDRHKIHQDYGVEPTTLHLQPFLYDDAKLFLSSFDAGIEADTVLHELADRALADFYGNPLTLTLVAELAKGGQGLPATRAELFDRASEILVREDNPAHKRSLVAQSTLEDLLNSAGAVFTHLLLSASTGVADVSRIEVPDGYVPKSELARIPGAILATEVLKTRLFRSETENLFVPIHRMIAEYLGARWLSKRLADGLSERRVLQGLTFAGGVPTPLRGLHAWLAHFNDRVADRCIRIDPFGVLRYGEPSRMPVARVRHLLSSLAALATEDPYFRSEDWNTRAVAGLVRPELKGEIVALIKDPSRPLHLSTLILESLARSNLAEQIAPELMAIVQDSNAAYVERSTATEALINSGLTIDWPPVVRSLGDKGTDDDMRLGIEIIEHTRGAGFMGTLIADAVVGYLRVPDDDDTRGRVTGVWFGLVKSIPQSLCAEVLDALASRFAVIEEPRHRRPGHEFFTMVQALVVKVLDDGPVPSPEMLWSWLRLLDAHAGYSSSDRNRISTFLKENTILRRQVQEIAFSDDRIDGAPWMAIVHDLPGASEGLSLTLHDTTEFLFKVALKNDLLNFDVELWDSLIRARRSLDGIPEEVVQAARLGFIKHPTLKAKWDDLNAARPRNWRAEQERREANARKKRTRRFQEHRTDFIADRDRIASGTNIGALQSMAHAYLGRYSDLDNDAEPVERLRDWLGDELTQIALTGFVAFLSRPDLPTAGQLAEAHASGKTWNVEAVMICGISEMVRLGHSLDQLPREVAKAALVTWWETPEFNSKRLGETIQIELEKTVLGSSEAIEDFLVTSIGPHIRSDRDHVPGLYRLSRDELFKPFAGELSLRWLIEYPQTRPATQWELVQTAIQHAPQEKVITLVRERLISLSEMEAETRRLWISAAFLVDFNQSEEIVSEFCNEDAARLWSIRDMILPDSWERGRWNSVSPKQLKFVVQKFSHRWPPGLRPSSGWGDTNPWNAWEFIGSCISALGSDASEAASAALDELVDDPNTRAYRDPIKHARAQQCRIKRDNEFRIPSFDAVKRTLEGGLPGNIDDLKAMVLDYLDGVQYYIRNSETSTWEAYWREGTPKDENTCRDRLVDALRGRLPSEIALLPETIMPESNRVDINAIYNGNGVPVEVKGQWHVELWDASKTQLDEKYCRDWRAHGRGVYLVLWFGNVHAKNKDLRGHPDGLPLPSSPIQLRDMLLDRLTDAERARIDVFVLDLSRP